MPKNTTSAVARRERALKYSAICDRLGPVGQAAERAADARRSRAARPSAARTGVMPYVVIEGELVGGLEPARGIRLGTAASLAGIHISVTASMMKVAMAAQATMSRAGVAEQRDDRDRGEERRTGSGRR